MPKRDFIESSGNVFADLGLVDAEERLAKAELAQKVGEILRKRGLTQAQAAVILGIDQPKVSALLCGRLARFSIDKLMQFVLLLGQDVSITIRPRRGPRSSSKTRGAGMHGGRGRRGRLTVEEIVSAEPSRQRTAA